MIPHIFKVEGRTLTEADMDALISENVHSCSLSDKKDAIDMIADALTMDMPITLDGKPVTRENA